MNRTFFSILLILVIGTYSVNAQTSLAGRTYHHSNIMVDAMNDATKDLDKKLLEAKKKAIAEGEKKKGRFYTPDTFFRYLIIYCFISFISYI